VSFSKVFSLLISLRCCIAEDLPPQVLTLSRIQAHARHDLAEVQNYTCTQVVHRYYKAKGTKSRMRPLDTVRLEVAHLGDRELYSSPGDRSFREGAPSAFTGSGMMGNGAFALHLRALFVDRWATFAYRGYEDLEGRAAIRYDFRIPLLGSGYTIAVLDAQAKVSRKGSFWVDKNSLDLLRLEIHADEIPSTLPVVDVSTTIDYARVRIGDSDLLLPQTANLHLAETSGIENRNIIDFTQCRSFSAQSTVSFDKVPPNKGATGPSAIQNTFPVVAATEEARTPAGLLIPIVLSSPITEHMSVGELLQGRVAGNIRFKGTILIPDGSPARGRIRRLERHSDAGAYFIVGLEFTNIEGMKSTILFDADLREVDRMPGVEWIIGNSSLHSRRFPGGGRVDVSTTENVLRDELPGVGLFFVRGGTFTLPLGFRMLWKTRGNK
jgi:hypothetical protein